MRIDTKFDIGDTVYHFLSGEKGVVVAIMSLPRGYTEYRVSTGLGAYSYVCEQELTKEEVIVV